MSELNTGGAISLTGVSFAYDVPYQEVFKDLNLILDSGWKTGLVGLNGRGKTTLLNLLGGELTPGAGNLRCDFSLMRFDPEFGGEGLLARDVIKERAGFREIELEMEELLTRLGSDEDALEVYGRLQDVYEAAGGYELDLRIDEEAVGLDITDAMLARPFVELSGGERTRVLLCGLFLRTGGLPVLDEPTNHLDRAGRDLLGKYLANSRRGFILASHDRDLLDKSVDHIVALDKNGVNLYAGNYTTWRDVRDETDRREGREKTNLEREVRSLRDSARKRRGWSARKEKEKQGAFDKGFVSARAARQMKRALTLERRIENNLKEKEELLKNYERRRHLNPARSDSREKTYLETHNLEVRIEERTILAGINIRADIDTRLAIRGPNGAGKSLLLDTLAGERASGGGSLYRNPRIKISRVYQFPLWSKGALSERIDSKDFEETKFRHIMAALYLTGDIFERPLESFSGGQLAKIDICRSLCEGADLYLWDEPLNYLDILSRETLENVQKDSRVGFIFVEHDRRFVENFAREIIDLPGEFRPINPPPPGRDG